MKGDNNEKGHEFNGTVTDNRISNATQDLSINNKIAAITQEFKSKIDSGFATLMRNFKYSMSQTCLGVQQDF